MNYSRAQYIPTLNGITSFSLTKDPFASINLSGLKLKGSWKIPGLLKREFMSAIIMEFYVVTCIASQLYRVLVLSSYLFLRHTYLFYSKIFVIKISYSPSWEKMLRDFRDAMYFQHHGLCIDHSKCMVREKIPQYDKIYQIIVVFSDDHLFLSWYVISCPSGIVSCSSRNNFSWTFG